MRGLTSWRTIGVALGFAGGGLPIVTLLPEEARAQSATAPPAAGGVIELPAVQVVDTSPLHGTGIAADKVPDPVNAVSAQDVQRLFTFSVTDGLFQYIPGVTTSDVQGNPFFQDFRFRGFAATRLDLYRTLVRAGGAGLSVATLQEKHGIPASTLSHHLRRLIDTGLVTQER